MTRPSSGMLEETVFHRMVTLERKRTDRSNRPFVLMLLRFAPLAAGDEIPAATRRFLTALQSRTRETDVKGWYRNNETVGCIFTEVDAEDLVALKRVLLQKVVSALNVTIGLEHLEALNVSFHVYPEEWEQDDGKRKHPNPVLYPDQADFAQRAQAPHALKRGIDVLGSIAALVSLCPLLILIAAAVRLSSPGPVLYRQKRIGRFGKPFTFLKFRSMYIETDDGIHKTYVSRFISGRLPESTDAAAVFKITSDPRVTAVGKLLRRFSLDELPQLFNVLKGDMSLVGPRPPVPYEVACYQPWHRRRLLNVKPGITGLWQVSGRSRVKFNDMVRLDLQYETSWSLWLDIRILLQTPGAVLSGDGAY